MVLSKEDTSPLLPESDDEKEEKKGEKPPAEQPKEKKVAVKVRIDLEDIDQRILALPLPWQPLAAATITSARPAS